MINYQGKPPSLLQRVFPFLKAQGDAPLPVYATYALPQATWRLRGTKAFFKEGYKLNSAVYAVSRALATGFADAPMRVYHDDGKTLYPEHPLQKLLTTPNPIMGEDEFWQHMIVNAANGGDAFGAIVPNNAGEPGQIWPYNSLTTWAVPTVTKWIDHYNYSPDGSTNKVERKEIEEIFHIRWSPDPEAPWQGLPALAAVAREVDSDNELTRYLKSLIENDATPRTAIKLPPGSTMSDKQRNEQKLKWQAEYSQANRGGIAFLQDGADIVRLSLDMGELAFDDIRGVPEARIAAAYGVPAIVAGLNIGLERSTYSNFEEARRMFTEMTLVPKWNYVASGFQQKTRPRYKRQDFIVQFDLSKVRALADNTSQTATWVVPAWDKGLLKRNNALALLGQPTIEGPEGEMYKTPGPAPVPVSVDNMKTLANGNGHGVVDVKELVGG